MKEILLTTLRDKNSSLTQFREATENLATILAVETGASLNKQIFEIETPLVKATGFELVNSLVIVPILRSGLALLPAFLKFFPTAKVGFIGLKRDEVTTIPHMYFQNIPKINSKDKVIILEPMLATGGSLIYALNLLVELAVPQENIVVVSFVGAPEGIKYIKNKMPNIHLNVVAVDEKLNGQNFILPGLGDFGDRFFGTE